MTTKSGNNKVGLGDTGRAVAFNLARIRRDRGLSFAALESATNEAGHRVPAISIRRIEDGTRRVDVDDLMSLSHALGVSPTSLLLDHESDFPAVTALPDGLEVGLARAWVKGEIEDFSIESRHSLAARRLDLLIGKAAIDRSIRNQAAESLSKDPDNPYLNNLLKSFDENYASTLQWVEECRKTEAVLRNEMREARGVTTPRPMLPWELSFAGLLTEVEWVEVDKFSDG